MVSGAVGALVGVGVFTVFAAVGIGIGALITGGDLVTPVVGTASLGIYAAALVGIGVAVGGVVGTGAAGPTVAVLTVLIWTIDIIGPPLGLPDAVQELALTSHFGQPMLGSWDPVGIVASLAIAAGGVAIGARGFARRDLRR